MKIPKKITPCPIVSAVAELRFSTDLPAEVVLGSAFPLFREEFSNFEKLPITDVPSFVRDQQPDLEFAPYYQLRSDKFMVQVGPKCFSVLPVGEYPGWGAYGPTTVRLFQKFLGAGIVKKVIRTSLRYTNFFAGDVLSNLNVQVTLDEKPLKATETVIRSLTEWAGFPQILQITNTAKQNTTIGTLVDVDTLLLTVPDGFSDQYPYILESLHAAEKSLFYSVLKQSFVETLSPEY